MRPDSEFEFSAQSEDGIMSAVWAADSRDRIRAVDEVIVICGEHTDASPRVAAELRMVQEEGKPHLFLWGRRDRMCKKPEGARPEDAMYRWTRDTLESQMTTTLRIAKLPALREGGEPPLG